MSQPFAASNQHGTSAAARGGLGRYGTLLIGIAFLAVAWAVTFHSIQSERRRIEAEAYQNAGNLGRAFEQHIIGVMRGVDQTLRHVRDAYGRDPDRFDMTAWSPSGSLLGPVTFQVAIVDKNGMLVASNLDPAAKPLDLSDRDHFRVQRDSTQDTLFISAPLLGRLSNKWSLNISRRIAMPDGSFGGVVVVSLDPAHLSRIYDSIDVGEMGTLSLFGSDGILRARGARQHVALGSSVANGRLMRELQHRDAGQYTVKGAIDGVERIYSFRRVDQLPLVVVVGFGKDEVYAAFESDRRKRLAAVAVFSVALVIVLLLMERYQARLQSAHRELEARERRYRAIADNLQQVVFRTDAEGRLVYVNAAWTTVIGHAAHEVLGHRLLEFVYNDDVDQRALFKAVLSGDKTSLHDVQMRFVSTTGAPRWVEATAQPTAGFADTEPGVFGTLTDVTERRAAEARIAAASAELSQRQNALDQAANVAVTDLDGRIVWVNDRFCTASGYTRAELIGKTHKVVSSGVHPPTFFQEMYATINAKRVWRGEICNRSRSGALRWYDTTIIPTRSADGEHTGFMAIRIDITARRRAEEAMRDSERIARQKSTQLEITLANISQGIMMIDGVGKVPVINRRAIELLGLPQGFDPAAATYADIVRHQWDSGEFGVEGELLSAEQRQYITADAHFRTPSIYERTRPNGTVLEVRSRPLREGGVVRTFTDISERKRAEAALSEARDAAERASRARAGFLAMISHEIRTPMNGVIGMAGLLIDSGLSGEQARFADTLRESAEHLLQLINDVLDFSKLDAHRLEIEEIPFDLTHLVDSTLQILAPRAHAKGLEVAAVMAPDLPRDVRGDPARLRQVLLNLIGNAIKFTSRGGVCVEVSCAPGDTSKRRRIAIAVVDTGIGIPQTALPQLFEEFSQVDSSVSRRFGGTGLGLAISKRLVTLMDGTISVESTMGLGSTFRVEAAFAAGEATPATQRLDGARVLVAERNPVQRRALRRQLALLGADVVATRSTSHAMSVLRRAAADKEPFAVALVGDSLAVAGLAAAIRAEPAVADMRVVLSVPSTFRRTAGGARVDGFDRVIMRPVPLAALEALLRNGAADETAEPLPPTEEKTTPRANLRILLAEDNQTNQLVAAKMLEALGYRADIVANGVEAVAAVRSAPYDVVFMDVMMPEMDGLAATRAIRALPAPAGATHIVALTANAFREDVEACRTAGMNDFLSKPITRDRLADALRRYLERRVEPMVPATSSAIGDPMDFDATVFDRFAEDLGSLDDAREVLMAFVGDAERRLTAIQAGVDAGATDLIEREAHAVKSASATFGFRRMSDLARELEQMATRIDPQRPVESLEPLIDALVAAFGVVSRLVAERKLAA